MCLLPKSSLCLKKECRHFPACLCLIKACQPRCREAKQEINTMGVPRVSLCVPCSGGHRWNWMRDTHHNLIFVELWGIFLHCCPEYLLQSFPRARLPPDFVSLIPEQYHRSYSIHTTIFPDFDIFPPKNKSIPLFQGSRRMTTEGHIMPMFLSFL